MLLDNFSDTVRFWITFNEPFTFCHDGYGGNDAPGGRSSGFEDYMCAHTVLRAHGMTYRMFEKEYKRRFKSTCCMEVVPTSFFKYPLLQCFLSVYCCRFYGNNTGFGLD